MCYVQQQTNLRTRRQWQARLLEKTFRARVYKYLFLARAPIEFYPHSPGVSATYASNNKYRIIYDSAHVSVLNAYRYSASAF